MRGAECPRRSVPQQGIVTEAVNCVSQVGDVSGVRGDIGGVGCHGIVSGFELRAVNRVGAASRQVTVFDVGDFAGGFGAVRGAERGAIPQQGIVFKVANGIRQVGDVGGVGCHIIVSSFELRAVNRVGAASRQVASGDVGDFAGGISTVCGAECPRSSVPQQRVITETVNSVSQVGDVGGIRGDIGGVGCHGIVSGFELRAVNRVSAASRQVTVFDVSDFAGGISTVCGAECPRCSVPQQGIVTEAVNSVSQVGDVSGVRGDIGGVGCHGIVSGFQLRAVYRVSATSRQVTVFDVGDFAGGIGTVRGAERGAIPQQGIVFKVANGIRQGIDTVSVGGDIGSIGRYVIVGGFQLRTVNRILTGIRNSAVFNVGDGTGSICTMCRTICLFKGVPL